MQSDLSTTPFGRRPMSLAMLANQINAKECPPETLVNKWRVLDAIREGRAAIGVSGRSLVVLSVLLNFHPGTTLAADGPIIVYPSNERLAERSGLPERTLRRHLRQLVDHGLIIRRDSPNGKRYARKGQGGQVEVAFGFDLSPLIARAAEFEALSETAKADKRARAILRERITLCRRDIRKMIDTGREEEVVADWDKFEAAFAPLTSRISRGASIADMQPFADGLEQLSCQITKVLEEHIKITKISGNAGQNGQHIQNSNPDTISELEPGLPISQGPISEPQLEKARPPQRSYPLGMILEACPDIIPYAKHGIHAWRDLIDTANLVRSMLGISPSAWETANEVFGPIDAAIVVAAILQRGDSIKSAGGYLRNLTEKARAGQFSLGPVLMALIRTNLREQGRRHA